MNSKCSLLYQELEECALLVQNLHTDYPDHRLLYDEGRCIAEGQRVGLRLGAEVKPRLPEWLVVISGDEWWLVRVRQGK